MTPDERPGPFETAEAHYANHRPGYGEDAIQYLRDRFRLDEGARVLDLGCGPGQLSVPLAAHAGSVVGMDPNAEMLRLARERARSAGRENVEWVEGTDADVGDQLGQIRLATMGRSFHRMDHERTLERIRRIAEPGGGVALLNDDEWFTRGTREWQDAVYAVAASYRDDLPERTGPIEEYDDPWDELLEANGFEDVEVAVFESDREWDIDGIVGYVFSLSYCSPRTFGTDREAFEAALRDRLDELGRDAFVQDVKLRVISGRT